MSKHTKGPWIVDTNYSCRPDYVGISSIGDPREHVGLAEVVVGIEGDDYPKGRANAHLISSAPEMLEALEQVVSVLTSKEYRSWMERVAMVDPALLSEDMPRVDLASARAAIAKAKGETP